MLAYKPPPYFALFFQEVVKKDADVSVNPGRVHGLRSSQDRGFAGFF